MKFNPECMLDPEVYDHPVENLEIIETHISWVVLTGYYAYKIKKPVDFGFLDFTTQGKRRHYCEQELFLNRRMAAELYLEVVKISGSRDKPRLNGKGRAFEYAVKMLQFPKSAEFDVMLKAGELTMNHIDAVAEMIAEFHQHISVADEFIEYGDADVINDPVKENFKLIRQQLSPHHYADQLAKLDRWSHLTFEGAISLFKKRKRAGFVRECHGDMHLRNLLWFKDRPVAFDCIEFNASLRWIDVISEIAFLLMDLHNQNQPQLANRFLNRYLEVSGDYDGLSVLAFYKVYRALVRAKVEILSLQQVVDSEAIRSQKLAMFESYLKLALRYTEKQQPMLIVMRGASASGKSVISQQLIDATWPAAADIIRIRSDVERKRLFASDKSNKSANKVQAIDTGLYSKSVTEKTYKRLLDLASSIISAGYSVVVDATFQEYEYRDVFKQLANDAGARYSIIELTAPIEVLRQRISARKGDVSDANLSVIEHQLSNWQPLKEDEFNDLISLDTELPLDIDALVKQLSPAAESSKK